MPAPRPKVFFLIPSLVQGGAERQMLEVVRRLPARFEPVLCLFADDIYYRQLLPAGQPRYILGTRKMNRAAFARLVEIMRDERPAIFHAYLNPANFWGRLAARRAGVPAIVSSVRARMIEWRYLVTERALSGDRGHIVVNSVGVQRELTDIARVPAERIKVLHNFIDPDIFRPPTRDERAAARRQWALDDDTRALLLPGRVCMQKHQIGLLLALDDLRRDGRLPANVQLLLAGRTSGGTTVPLVHRLRARPGLANVVRLLGAQSDIRSLYWAADALVLPSLWEGLPNAALEGSACGLPALLSHAANLDGIVIPDVTGFEVPTADRAALTDGLARLLALTAAESATMGRRGTAHIRETFAPDRVGRELWAYYDALVAKG